MAGYSCIYEFLCWVMGYHILFSDGPIISIWPLLGDTHISSGNYLFEPCGVFMRCPNWVSSSHIRLVGLGPSITYDRANLKGYLWNSLFQVQLGVVSRVPGLYAIVEGQEKLFKFLIGIRPVLCI